ncbi:hypothetical protein CAPTEDRAFT_191303 [Capitella teleta]|uniref:Uncharacterized protein n=1 Tax=Capitella teleta TaxID=283909 RepID=R7UF27_CAPTE|nr:hypothetical protein CAPTEDRAFT_191303 [Capitella teleta]|eukprot:ELU01877.1 hypothetical protein CAPTEDRAFT_191303 [Capitella teleta]
MLRPKLVEQSVIQPSQMNSSTIRVRLAIALALMPWANSFQGVSNNVTLNSQFLKPKFFQDSMHQGQLALYMLMGALINGMPNAGFNFGAAPASAHPVVEAGTDNLINYYTIVAPLGEHFDNVIRIITAQETGNINAYQEGNGIIIDCMTYQDMSFMRQLSLKIIRAANKTWPISTISELKCFIINLPSGSVKMDNFEYHQGVFLVDYLYKFIERGASVNAAADDIVQPVHLATEYTIADIMRILLQFAADAKPTSKKESSFTLLQRDIPTTINLLLRHGTDPRAQTTHEWSSYAKQFEKVKSIYICDKTINDPKNFGQSLWHSSSFLCAEEEYEMDSIIISSISLLCKTANCATDSMMNTKFIFGWTPGFKVIMDSNRPVQNECGQLFFDQPGWHEQMTEEETDLLRAYVRAGLNPTDIDNQAASMIYYTAASGMFNALDFLLNQCGNECPNWRDKDRSTTPLHYAASFGRIKSCENNIVRTERMQEKHQRQSWQNSM